MKVLILKPSSLGDVIQALPVLRLLKRHHPQGHFYWWIESALAELLRGDSDLDGLFVFQRKRWSKLRYLPEVWRQVRLMRSFQFDCILDLQALARSSILGWLANGKRLIGLQDFREFAPALYTESIPRPTYETHAVDWYLEALRSLEIPVSLDFDWIPKRPEVEARLESRWNLSASQWIVLQPGARWENKRWPAEYWRTLIQQLHATYPRLRCVILGGKDDLPTVERIMVGFEGAVVNAVGRTSLQEMVEWIRASCLMITNDTGPMHVAAALGVPVVGIFGPTHPMRTGPYGQTRQAIQSAIPCVPCMKPQCHNQDRLACLRGISPAEVFQIAKQRLAPMLIK